MRYKGDVNKNNIIGTLDATHILSYIEGDTGYDLDDEQRLRADLTADNNVNLDDVEYLLSYLMEKQGMVYRRLILQNR